MKDISKDAQSLRQFFLNARDEKQERIVLGLESTSYGRAFATYSIKKEPQAKKFNNLPTKLKVFNRLSLQAAMRTNDEGRNIPIGILAGPTSKVITEHKTYLLKNLPTLEKPEKPTAPPANVKNTRRYYDISVEQYDGNNDGITYKKSFSAKLKRHPRL